MKCWQWKKCGREGGGVKAHELGVCPAYPDHAHDCWKIAGTFCGGIVQGTEAQKQKSCLTCDWYLMVNPLTGTKQEILND
jgi:hypothetical protein